MQQENMRLLLPVYSESKAGYCVKENSMQHENIRSLLPVYSESKSG